MRISRNSFVSDGALAQGKYENDVGERMRCTVTSEEMASTGMLTHFTFNEGMHLVNFIFRFL